MGQCFHQNRNCFQKISTYFDLLTNEIEGKLETQTCQAINESRLSLRQFGGQCIPLVNGIMNIEYDPKEVVKSFIDLVNMAKGLLDENQQPSVQQEL